MVISEISVHMHTAKIKGNLLLSLQDLNLSSINKKSMMVSVVLSSSMYAATPTLRRYRLIYGVTH